MVQWSRSEIRRVFGCLALSHVFVGIIIKVVVKKNYLDKKQTPWLVCHELSPIIMYTRSQKCTKNCHIG